MFIEEREQASERMNNNIAGYEEKRERKRQKKIISTSPKPDSYPRKRDNLREKSIFFCYNIPQRWKSEGKGKKGDREKERDRE